MAAFPEVTKLHTSYQPLQPSECQPKTWIYLPPRLWQALDFNFGLPQPWKFLKVLLSSQVYAKHQPERTYVFLTLFFIYCITLVRGRMQTPC